MAKKPSIDEFFVREREQEKVARRLTLVVNDQKKQMEFYRQEIDRLEAELTVALALGSRKNCQAAKHAPIDTGEACAILVISDVHLGETVLPSKVNGQNSFNAKVCEKRLAEVFRRYVDLLRQYRTLAKIKEGVIYLGGDLVTGTIHEELLESNDLSTPNAVLMAEEFIERGIRYVIKNSGLDKITVVCLSGNHDRTTNKIRHSTFVDNSYATIIYAHLRKRFLENPAIQFVIGDGEYAYTDIYGFKLRYTHGHRIKFGGGVGGLTIPWTKHVMRMNRENPADFTIGGHLHTFTVNYENGFLVNGSLIGDTPYSLPFGHQEPCQGMVVVDRKRCVTAAIPVFCE